ncbi:MAG TPA: hypothetical protein VK558_05240, partial [Patescibacteria group bacterium]|nr:hypothetical protein [Patescibacteria group bacterium]
GATVSDIDGVRVSTPDGWWLLRASNTQAVLVARCESGTEEGLVRLRGMLDAALEQTGVRERGAVVKGASPISESAGL